MATEPSYAETPGGRRPAGWVAAWFGAVIAGSALLGLLGGLIWGEVAPRAMLREIGTGTAELVNAETRAFIGADAWFCGIAVVAGLLTGILGYRFAVAPRTGAARPVLATGLILGAVAGAFCMLWLGERIGLASYNQHLASSANGTLFPASLSLGAKSALACWPLFTSVIVLIAEWGSGPTPRSAPTPRPAVAKNAGSAGAAPPGPAPQE